MQTTFALAALASAAFALPQGGQTSKAPEAPSPAGCSQNYNGDFQITIVNGSSTAVTKVCCAMLSGNVCTDFSSVKHPPVDKKVSSQRVSPTVFLPTPKAASVPSFRTTNFNSMDPLHKLAHSTHQASQSARTALWLSVVRQSSTLARVVTSPTSTIALGTRNASLSSSMFSHVVLLEVLLLAPLDNKLMVSQHSPPPPQLFLRYVHPLLMST